MTIMTIDSVDKKRRLTLMKRRHRVLKERIRIAKYRRESRERHDAGETRHPWQGAAFGGEW